MLRDFRLPLPVLAACLAASSVAACSTVDTAGVTNPPETVQILALNDLHGNLEPPPGQTTYVDGAERKQEQLGGVARLGAQLAAMRAGQAHTITVAAGDLIGASPLVSAFYLDEPTILALNLAGLEIAAVGNHEFDRGAAELRRMQDGGCDKYLVREPCAIDKDFSGAKFSYLAANVVDDQGQTLFPGTAMRQFGNIRIGFIGMTLKETGTLVSPAGTAGFAFTDEAETANRLAAELRSQGADALVLLIHQGAYVDSSYSVSGCPELSGPVLPILEKLDPKIRLVVSGHTHNAYVCHVPASDGSQRLVTSAGRYGYFATDIRMTVDPTTDSVIELSASNRPVSVASGEQADVADLVRRYTEAIEPVATRVVGRVSGSLEGGNRDLDSPLGRLIADSVLSATRSPEKGHADIAFINSGGVRTRFTPAADGSVTYGQIFALQPFGNTLTVLEMTGASLKEVLEEQFSAETPAVIRQSLLIPSDGFTFTYDVSAPVGQRVVDMKLAGSPIDTQRTYRIAVNNFLASGGDGFEAFARATPIADAGVDVDALEAFIRAGAVIPADNRITMLR